MKIKTANIRIFKKDGEKISTELKSVAVKKVFTYADEMFIVHRDAGRSWRVTHYRTGLAAYGNVRSLAGIEDKFASAMRTMGGDTLQKAIAAALEKHGVANELPC